MTSEPRIALSEERIRKALHRGAKKSGVESTPGWICPICDRGIAPFVDSCLCKEEIMGIINFTNTRTDED